MQEAVTASKRGREGEKAQPAENKSGPGDPIGDQTFAEGEETDGVPPPRNLRRSPSCETRIATARVSQDGCVLHHARPTGKQQPGGAWGRGAHLRGRKLLYLERCQLQERVVDLRCPTHNRVRRG